MAYLAGEGLTAGAIVSVQTLYDLGRDWYATRLDRDWQRADAVEAERIFARHGLTGPFWSLSRTPGSPS